MSTASRDITEAIKTLSGFDDLQFESVACKVSNVDANAMTCDCSPINGDANFLDVRLNANYKKGFTLIPKDNSVVIISQLSDATAYVSMVSEVDEIYLAGDANGGIVKATELTTKLNTIENQLNLIGVWALTVTPPLTLPPLTPTLATELENNKVKHGNS
jgi:hypothetical protein